MANRRDEIRRGANNGTFNSNGEVERKVFRIAGVVLQENESLVKVGIERRKVVQKALLLAEPLQRGLSWSDHDNVIHGRTHLREKEAGEPDIHQDALVHRLAEDPTNETIPVKAMFYYRHQEVIQHWMNDGKNDDLRSVA